METIKEVRISIKSNTDKTNCIRCKLCYDLGGTNSYTHREEPRGYYVSVYPVEEKGIWIISGAWSGYKQCIQPCKRKSKKQETIAEGKCIGAWKSIINRIIHENGYELIDSLDKLEA